MLNLSRSVGEIVHIGDDIAVQVEKITGNCVHLGFTAPREVAIYRDEVYRQRTAAGDAAAAAPPARDAGARHRHRSAPPHPARAETRHVAGRRRVTAARAPRVAGRMHRSPSGR